LVRIKSLHKWRLLNIFLDQLNEILKPEQINSFFPDVLELILEVMKSTAQEVKDKAITLYCKVVCHLPKFDQRKSAIKLFEEADKKENFKTKLTLLGFYGECLKVFSKPAIKYHILPTILISHTTSKLGVVLQCIAKMIPEINDAIDPADEAMTKKFFSMRQALEESTDKKVRELALQAANRINVRARAKAHLAEVSNRYKENRALEEFYFSPQYDEACLEDIYKKESGQYVSKLSTVKPPVRNPTRTPLTTPSNPGLIRKNTTTKDLEEKEEIQKAVTTTSTAGFGKYGASSQSGKRYFLVM
jgi:hypothetical protein